MQPTCESEGYFPPLPENGKKKLEFRTNSRGSICLLGSLKSSGKEKIHKRNVLR